MASYDAHDPDQPGPAEQTEFYDGFPTEPIGGGNPYHRCRCCRRSVPEINGLLTGHSRDCLWRRCVEAGLRQYMEFGAVPHDNLAEHVSCHQCGRELYPGDRGFGTRGAWCERCHDQDERGDS